MATVSTLPVATRRSQFLARLAGSDSLAVAAATAIALVFLGYHPYSEDGGIYASAISLHLSPSLFPAERGFAIAHTDRSLFVPLVSTIAQTLHISLPVVLLLCYVATLAATLAVATRLSKLLFHTVKEQRWAVLVLAVCMGLPIAGTSLYLADPYLTARSLSTPILLWSLASLLQRRSAMALLLLIVAFAFHPLMAAWAGLLLAAVFVLRSARPLLFTTVLSTFALGVMAFVQALAPAEGAAARAASLSRDYWFVSQWDWYEIAGMLAPVVLLLAIAFLLNSEHTSRSLRDLAVAAAVAASIVAVGSVLLIHTGNQSFLLARLQPLRLLHPVYLLFLLIAGGLLPRMRIRGRLHAGWIACVLAAAGLMFMQRQLYPSSGHLELPWQQPVNGYEQAFLWARANTPNDALFALDADYTTADGEDAQFFRSIALRSALPDAAKDGGIASVKPNLAQEWESGAKAQTGFNKASDIERITRVKPLGATWAILSASSKTAFTCPYANDVAKVCRLP